MAVECVFCEKYTSFCAVFNIKLAPFIQTAQLEGCNYIKTLTFRKFFSIFFFRELKPVIQLLKDEM